MKQRSISSFFQAKPSSQKPSASKLGAETGAGPVGEGSACIAAELTPSPSAQKEIHEPEVHRLPDAPRVKRQRTSEVVRVPDIPARDLQKAAKAHHKLVQDTVYDPAQAATTAAAASSKTTAGKGPKYTPLEQQVVELKQKHPGILLVIEVGYKFRCFGEDAEVAARLCNIYAFPDHNFLTCSFPVFRLPVYVRRLVNAGHKVGVVRQVETAAIKSQGASRNAPFERKLTALYTAATLEAGQKAEKAGEEGSLEEYAELVGDLDLGTGPAPKYILFVAEAPCMQHRSLTHGNSETGVEVCEILSSDEDMGEPSHIVTPSKRSTKASKQAAEHGSVTECDIALLAVEPSTGDVQLGLASAHSIELPTTPPTPDSRSKTAHTALSGSLLALESTLLSLSPAELVVLEPTTPSTMRMLQAYCGTVPGCRREVVRGWGPDCPTPRIHQQLVAMYAGSSAQQLEAAQKLPRHAQRVLAAAVDHLQQYGLQSIMQAQPALMQYDNRDVTSDSSQLPTQQGSAWQQMVTAAGLQPLSHARCMQLGPNALRQLEVLTSSNGSQYQGSLLHLLDRTRTAAGARTLRAWVAAPLADEGLITSRLDAVEELAGVRGTRTNTGPLSKLPNLLRKLPDLERGLTRLLHRTASPSELVTTLTALQEVPHALGISLQKAAGDGSGQPASAQPLFDAGSVASPLLATLVTAAAAPSVHAACMTLLSKIDTKAARENRTADCLTDTELFSDLVAGKAAVAAALQALQDLLPFLARQLGVRALDYTSVQNQGDWMIEVPVDMAKKVPKDWIKVSGTKKVNRFHPPQVQQAMLQLAIAKEKLAATAAAAYNRFLGMFAQHYNSCKAAAQSLAQLDALSSLAQVARTPGYCRPAISSPSVRAPHLVIRAGRHPMLDAQLTSGALPGFGTESAVSATGAVPNDIDLDYNGTRAAIITGPNMGGKSCLIRQAALIAIMAQIGSYVPADSCQLAVLDAVYSRMGASDNLVLGRSTFLEELSDASHILANATSRSLVIMDELGRGTATHDGVAIASATLSHLVDETQCLTLFVTHYPEVASLATSSQHIKAFHMAYVKEDETGSAMSTDEGSHNHIMQALSAAGDNVGHTSGEQLAHMTSDAQQHHAAAPRITFLYKLQQGAVDQSFGLNVAQMAGLPKSVVSQAALKAAELMQHAEDMKAIQTAQQMARHVRVMISNRV